MGITVFSSANVSQPAANTPAVVTYAAADGVVHVIRGIAWSYDGTPTGGGLKVEDGSGNTVFAVDITSSGAGSVQVQGRGSNNTALIITLAAGGAGVTGKLSILDHWVE